MINALMAAVVGGILAGITHGIWYIVLVYIILKAEWKDED